MERPVKHLCLPRCQPRPSPGFIARPLSQQAAPGFVVHTAAFFLLLPLLCCSRHLGSEQRGRGRGRGLLGAGRGDVIGARCQVQACHLLAAARCPFALPVAPSRKVSRPCSTQTRPLPILANRSRFSLPRKHTSTSPPPATHTLSIFCRQPNLVAESGLLRERGRERKPSLTASPRAVPQCGTAEHHVVADFTMFSNVELRIDMLVSPYKHSNVGSLLACAPNTPMVILNRRIHKISCSRQVSPQDTFPMHPLAFNQPVTEMRITRFEIATWQVATGHVTT